MTSAIVPGIDNMALTERVWHGCGTAPTVGGPFTDVTPSPHDGSMHWWTSSGWSLDLIREAATVVIGVIGIACVVIAGVRSLRRYRFIDDRSPLTPLLIGLGALWVAPWVWSAGRVIGVAFAGVVLLAAVPMAAFVWPLIVRLSGAQQSAQMRRGSAALAELRAKAGTDR